MKSERAGEQRDSRDRILAKAEEVFSEKGFDGARVDEIAKRAGVNKALIYYYFKSKDEILEILFKKLLDELVELTEVDKFEDFKASPERLMDYLGRYIRYLEEHQSLLRIFLMESLKLGTKRNLTEKFFDSILRFERETAEKMGLKFENFNDILIIDFFTAIMPMTGYVVYRDLWCKRFGLTRGELQEKFLSAFYNTHVAYSVKIMLEASAGGEKN